MSEYYIDNKFLLTESDVEQKIIWPLLTNQEPLGLGYNETHIQTKLSLKKLLIEKRQKTKLFYPDYLILIEGLPLVVVEAKKPNDDLEEAFREARLYSLEINALYKKELNPCKLIIATDGLRLIAGSWDCKTPQIDIEINDWVSTNESFSNFIDLFSFRTIKKSASQIRKELRKNVIFSKPTHLLGGKHIQNQLIKNSFGETISIQYRHLFNPSEESERTDIVRNAYVKVQKHMSHVNPIDRLIRKKIRPSIQDSIEINDNTTPDEILDKLKEAHNYNNEVLLLIGSVGSGKSTFTTYLRDIALDKELTERLIWLRLDLNLAPVNTDEIYLWLKNNICIDLQKTLPEFDADQIESIKKIFSEDLEKFNKVALRLFVENTDKYNEKLFDEIQNLLSNIDKKLKAYISYYVHSRGKELVIVLDNCDKRNLEEQLLMFEVASWLKDNTKSIVFLPLRETTFDHFRHVKPLDTVIKDLIFRINPPSLENVLYNRVKYASRLSEKSENRYYYLPNGIKVYYPSKDELSYLKSILKSLFQNNFFKKLMVGLAGRDIRKGIEVFLDFCKSGHITEGDILNMKQSNGEYSLPNHIVSRVFIRGNRLYYSDSDTKVKNLFYSEPSDELPDPFTRVAILSWLKTRNILKGPSGIVGFHKVSDMIKDLTILGHSLQRLDAELKTLVKTSLIITESQDANKIEIDELISIDVPGLTHLNLLENIDYLSACAEDVWYRKETIAKEIAERISGNAGYSHLSLQNSLFNTTDLISYLEEYSNEYYSQQRDVIVGESYSLPNQIERIKENIQKFKSSIGISEFREFEEGSIVNASVVNIFDYGLICELDGSHQIGLLHISEMEKETSEYDIGDTFEVEIVCYQTRHKKYKLRLTNN